MRLRKCRACGELFPSDGRDICPVCFDAEEAAFEKVKAYLDEHPDAGAEAVCAGTGVSYATVLEFLRQGRLQYGDRPAGTHRCARCDAPVAEGRYCRACLDYLKDVLHKAGSGAAAGPSSPPSGPGAGSRLRFVPPSRPRRGGLNN